MVEQEVSAHKQKKEALKKKTEKKRSRLRMIKTDKEPTKNVQSMFGPLLLSEEEDEDYLELRQALMNEYTQYCMDQQRMHDGQAHRYRQSQGNALRELPEWRRKEALKPKPVTFPRNRWLPTETPPIPGYARTLQTQD